MLWGSKEKKVIVPAFEKSVSHREKLCVIANGRNKTSPHVMEAEECQPASTGGFQHPFPT